MNIQFYILGYMDTNLAFGKKLKLPKSSPKRLAKIVYKNRKRKFEKIFFPRWWGIIAIILNLTPHKILLFLDKILVMEDRTPVLSITSSLIYEE